MNALQDECPACAGAEGHAVGCPMDAAQRSPAEREADAVFLLWVKAEREHAVLADPVFQYCADDKWMKQQRQRAMQADRALARARSQLRAGRSAVAS